MFPFRNRNLMQQNEITALVSLARDGDQGAFRELYQRHKAGIFTLAVRMTGDRAEAEDITQEVFIRAFRGLAGYRGDSAFSTWLYRIAVNCCQGRIRSGGNKKSVPLDRVEIGSDSMQLRADLGRLLESAITRLPEGCREVFVLHDVQGMGHAEIAGILGCSEANARSQLWRARGRLREMVAPHLESEADCYEVSELDREAAEPAG